MITHFFSDQSLAGSNFNITISSGISFPFPDPSLLYDSDFELLPVPEV